MSWFKTILLVGVLGMTWAECDRPPLEHTRAWPEAAFEPASTNAAYLPALVPVSSPAPAPAERRDENSAAPQSPARRTHDAQTIRTSARAPRDPLILTGLPPGPTSEKHR
jgi:hypothetical protein